MLENKPPSRIGFYIIFSILLSILCFFIYQTADYKSAYKWRGVEINMMKGEVEEAKNATKEMQKLAQQFYTRAMQYEEILRRGVIIERDTTILVKKGTIVIPQVYKK